MTELPPDAGPVDRLRPGTLLREWRIGRFIGRGAYGQVFERTGRHGCPERRRGR